MLRYYMSGMAANFLNLIQYRHCSLSKQMEKDTIATIFNNFGISLYMQKQVNQFSVTCRPSDEEPHIKKTMKGKTEKIELICR